jgi:hypothetical protein
MHSTSQSENGHCDKLAVTVTVAVTPEPEPEPEPEISPNRISTEPLETTVTTTVMPTEQLTPYEVQRRKTNRKIG